MQNSVTLLMHLASFPQTLKYPIVNRFQVSGTRSVGNSGILQFFFWDLRNSCKGDWELQVMDSRLPDWLEKELISSKIIRRIRPERSWNYGPFIRLYELTHKANRLILNYHIVAMIKDIK